MRDDDGGPLPSRSFKLSEIRRGWGGGVIRGRGEWTGPLREKLPEMDEADLGGSTVNI